MGNWGMQAMSTGLLPHSLQDNLPSLNSLLAGAIPVELPQMDKPIAGGETRVGNWGMQTLPTSLLPYLFQDNLPSLNSLLAEAIPVDFPQMDKPIAGETTVRVS
jgi:hypothetical protein